MEPYSCKTVIAQHNKWMYAVVSNEAIHIWRASHIRQIEWLTWNHEHSNQCSHFALPAPSLPLATNRRLINDIQQPLKVSARNLRPGTLGVANILCKLLQKDMENLKEWCDSNKPLPQLPVQTACKWIGSAWSTTHQCLLASASSNDATSERSYTFPTTPTLLRSRHRPTHVGMVFSQRRLPTTSGHLQALAVGTQHYLRKKTPLGTATQLLPRWPQNFK